MHLLNTVARAAVLVAGIASIAAAHAATTTYTVNTLAAGLADANAGNGVCETATPGECSLRAALEEVNAAPASPGDDFAIVFAAGLSGDIQPTASAQRMITTALGSTVINDYLGQGAFYHVNARRPVTIDFENRIGVVQQNDLEHAAFFIESDDVLIQNFQNDAKRDLVGGGFENVAGIVGAASAFVIGGSRVTIRNGLSSDQATDAMESCVSLIDGASDILVEDYYCRGSAGFGLYVDERATVSNVRLDRFETQDGVRFGDIWVESGEAGETGVKTIVNGLTITDSEFRSSAINYTMGFRENAIVDALSITGSRFLGTNAPGIYAYPTSTVGTATIENNAATGTGFFVGTDVSVIHTGLLAIRGNTLSGNLNDAVFLQSPTSGTVIENNQFLNQRSASLVAGVRIATGASGTNNVIRNNVFDQASPVTDPPAPTNRFAIWMRANPNGAGGTGSSGWSILNNTVRNIFGTDFGPIYNDGDNNTLIAGNTFGVGTRGAVSPDPAPENDDSFFVVNADSFSNGKIQTWRPTGAVFSGVSIRATFAPVDPPRAGNAAATTPVFIDVYYTATDKAETYLGRIPGSYSSEVTFEFTSTATSGAVRAQVTDAAGRSSQYSAAIALQQGLDAGADDDMDGLPNGAECVINALGIPQLCPDSDGDGTPNFQDPDDDNDGIPTRVECPTGSPCVNTDGDLQPNHLDLDSDGDGISDARECPQQACRDTDGDGIANYVDTDSDGDGLVDAAECPDSNACADVDGNGIEDYLEPPAPIIVRGKGGAFGGWSLLMLGGLALLRRRAVLLAALLGLATSFNAQAADVPAEENDSWLSHFYVGAKVGAIFTNFDDGDLSRGLQAAGFNLQAESDKSDKLGYGIWLGYAVNPVLGLELSYTTGADESVRYSGATVGDLEGVLDAAAPHLNGYGDSYLTRLRYHYAFSDRWFLSPHVGVGITRTRESVTSGPRRAKQTDTSFTWAAGAGLHYALTPDWSIGVGADYYASARSNAYAMISGILEWRFPSAFRGRQHDLAQDSREPARVVPVVTSSLPAIAAVETSPVPEPATPVTDISLDGVVFASNSAELAAESSSILDAASTALLAILQARPQARFEAGGHTDATGNSANNRLLSQSRAEAVRRYLVDKGVPGDRLTATGYGASQPIASNETVEGRARNRRVALKAVDGS